MGTTESGSERRRIANFDARCRPIALRDGPLALWQIDDLEQYIDRRALLADADGPEPPYWALCWSGARVLADVVLPPAELVIEVGCGLGLPGLAAARRGASVTCCDRVAAPLAFVQASAKSNALDRVAVVAADLTALPLVGGVDLLLAAEVLYDRAAFAPFAKEIARVLRPRGEAWLTDGGRIDTRDFYRSLAGVGLIAERRAVRVDEEGWPVTIEVVRIRHAHPIP